ncbi:DNA-binding response regulator [Janibacter melonis]|uniref:DNA-binding response regulator n=1 Tax=Janibacter melonis TaxID=262209 RepID=A0A650GFC2_9MICO|nr:response regulator transcription factor [Janibacter melonis]QGX08612.1 DNA-binding response regulator [Janibacter melonis]
MSPADGVAPIRVALLDDCEMVARGVAAMLADHPGRVDLVEADHRLVVAQPVDIALWDAFAPGASAKDRPGAVDDSLVRRTVLYTWDVSSRSVRLAQERHLSGVLSKSASTGRLVDALERVDAGDLVVMGPEHEVTEEWAEGDGWPGRAEGLTRRQSDVVRLVVVGLSNQQIAHACYLSMNSVKSCIRAAYRTMGVSSRSQAVLWGVDHGFRHHHP